METNLIGKRIVARVTTSTEARSAVGGFVVGAIESKYKTSELPTIDLFVECNEGGDICSIRRVAIHQIIKIEKGEK